jgi:hypothetical protein
LAWRPGRRGRKRPARPGRSTADGATDEALLDWARANGPFGIVGARPFDEPVEQIRSELRHLAATRRLLRALRDRPGDDALHAAAIAAAGHEVDPGLIAAPTPIRSQRGDAPLSGKARADIMALNALGAAIQQGLRGRALVGAVVTGDRQEMRLQASLLAMSPIAAAYLLPIGRLRYAIAAPRVLAGTRFRTIRMLAG